MCSSSNLKICVSLRSRFWATILTALHKRIAHCKREGNVTHKIRYGKYLNILAYAVLSVVIAYAAIPRGGILLSHDSVAYLYAADSFRESGKFFYFGYGTPMIQWPLFIPAFLSAVKSFSPDAAVFMRYFNPVLLGLAIYMGGLLCHKFIKSKLFINLAMLIMACSTYLFWIYYHLWSECFFIFFIPLLIYMTILYIENGKFRYLIISGIAAGLMMWTRFTGMELAGLILILLFINGKTLRRRFFDAIVYGVIAFLPFCCLLLSNYIASGTFSGRSKPSITPFKMNITDTLSSFGRFFIPDAWGTVLYITIMIAAAAAVFTFIIFIAKREEWIRSKIKLVYILIAVHIVCYTAMCIYSNTFYALDRLSARLYSPIFFLCVIALFWALEQVCGLPLKTRLPAGLIKAFAAVAVLAVCVMNIMHISQTGPGMIGHFSEANLKNDELITYFKALDIDPENTKIYTNHPGEVIFMTGVETNYTPRREGAEIYCLDAYLERYDGTMANYYLWYDDPGTNPLLYTPEELGEMFGDIVLIASLPSGKIYKAG